MITTLAEKRVVGRKPYSCGLCAWTIKKGERHFAQTNADGGDIWTWRVHLACLAALPAYLKACDLPPWWMDGYETIDDAEFRIFIQSRHRASEA